MTVFNPYSRRTDAAPILFPAPDQVDVPIRGKETVSGLEGKDMGFPITLWFQGQPPIKESKIRMTDSQGTPVECLLSTPGKFLSAAYPKNLWVLIPTQALKANEEYRLETDLGQGTNLSWKFRTAKE